MGIKKVIAIALLTALCVSVFSGCVKREIVTGEVKSLVPDVTGNTEPLADEDIDWDQVYDGVNGGLSGNADFPKSVVISVYTMDDPVSDEENAEVLVAEWCVTDDCVDEEACKYGEALIKAINDEISVQDSTIRESGESDYGGYFDTHPVLVRVYHVDAENNPLESEVYQYIQEGTHGACMEYFKASELETMEDEESSASQQ